MKNCLPRRLGNDKISYRAQSPTCNWLLNRICEVSSQVKAAFSLMAGASSPEAAHCKLQDSPKCKWNWKMSNYLLYSYLSFTWEKRMNCDNFATFAFLKVNWKTFVWGSNLKKKCCLCNCGIPHKRQNMFLHALNSVIFFISATFSNSTCISIC